MSILEALKGLVEVTLRNINMRLNMPIVLFGKNEQTTINHYHYYDAQNKRGIMETATGVGCPAESGKDQVGARNCAASGNEESQAADGMP